MNKNTGFGTSIAEYNVLMNLKQHILSPDEIRIPMGKVSGTSSQHQPIDGEPRRRLLSENPLQPRQFVTVPAYFSQAPSPYMWIRNNLANHAFP
jgi:hypothetical protein